MDPCLTLVNGARSRPEWALWQTLLARPMRRAFVYADTPQDRLERAVHRELTDLAERAARALGSLAVDGEAAAVVGEARGLLQRAGAEGCFPRQDLQRLSTGLHTADAASGNTRLHRELGLWIDMHARLERRLRWLLNPDVTRDVLGTLDPVEDSDQLTCFFKYEFRPEFLFCGWGNTIERISQLETTATFFNATGAAEHNPLRRSEDTLVLLYNCFDWGLDSYHGRKSVASINRIHGRYFVHNDGMKYVLLNGCFSVLDSLDVVGHRPITEQERLGFFHTHIKIGQAMHIQEISHSWDEMYAWFHAVNRAHAAYTPHKRRMWLSLEDNFDRTARVPLLVSRFRRRLEITGMDDTTRSALGFERPGRATVAVCRSVVKGVARLRRLLPRGPYVESLQDFLSYPNGVHVDDAGEKARSPKMPVTCPFSGKTHSAEHVGHPENQPPLMSVNDAPDMPLAVIGWDEVRRHNTPDDLWIVFGGHVYDVSSFARNHPGGLEILLRGAGRDLTLSFEQANHNEITKVFTLNFRIGRIESTSPASLRRVGREIEARV